MEKVSIEESWLEQLQEEFKKPYMKELKAFLKREYDSKKTIYPATQNYFEAFNQTPFKDVKVVIVGQDPYHGPNQAHGLCFSVKPGVRTPPSLVNIYKELCSDLHIKERPSSGYLISWAKQGVLLLNSTLTVEKGKAGSHQNKGWETFTDAALERLNSQKENLVFILWGSYAQKKGAFINSQEHLVLKAPHPSPLSAHRGFLGSKPFSKTNSYLESKGLAPLNWGSIF